MGFLTTNVKYESGINSRDQITPSSVKKMLCEIRDSIGKIHPPFLKLGMKEILEIVESEEYVIEGTLQTKIALKEAEAVIDEYRDMSEGGCRSCKHRIAAVADAQDGTRYHYCNAFEKYDDGREGFSEMVNKHYKSPCSKWIPERAPTLDKLLE